MSASVVLAPSQELLACSISSVDGDESGGVVGGDDKRGAEMRPPVAPKPAARRRRGVRKLRRVRVQDPVEDCRRNRARREEIAEEEEERRSVGAVEKTK